MRRLFLLALLLVASGACQEGKKKGASFKGGASKPTPGNPGVTPNTIAPQSVSGQGTPPACEAPSTQAAPSGSSPFVQEESCAIMRVPAEGECALAQNCYLPNGSGTRAASCESGDQPCAATQCDPGFHLQSGNCVQDCVPGATSALECPVAGGGTGSKTRTCAADGSWAQYLDCQVSSCPAGHYISDSGCKKDCDQGATDSMSCPIKFGEGAAKRSCTAEGRWGPYGPCLPILCVANRHISGALCVADFCAMLYHDDGFSGGGYQLPSPSTITNYASTGFNDKASSLKVVIGCTLIAWQDKDFVKGPWTFTVGNYSDLDPYDANDDFSSSKCTCE